MGHLGDEGKAVGGRIPAALLFSDHGGRMYSSLHYSLQTPRRPPTAGFSFIRFRSEFGPDRCRTSSGSPAIFAAIRRALRICSRQKATWNK
jgi:hypothetical protein